MRRYDRKPAQLSFTVRIARSHAPGSMHLDSADLSEGGAFLRSDLLFEVGELLNLEIPLLSGAVVKTSGRVVRVARNRDPAAARGMGIEFTALSPDERRLIHEATP
jgi:hypothetical protein